MGNDYIKGVKCPLCEEEEMVVIENHRLARVSFGLKWYHCEPCDKDVCRDKLSGGWKISAYDVYRKRSIDQEL